MTRTLCSISVLTVSVLLATYTPANASGTMSCWHGRDIARAQYEGCFYRVRGSRGAEKCLARYLGAWAVLQQLTGTPCATVRLVDNGDGTVTDNLTGLVWEKKANLDGVVNASDPHDADNVYSWSKADADPTNEDGTAFTDFLTSLNSGAGFANTNGWRLPTLAELYTLYSLVDGECHKPPCINPVFGTTPIDDFSFYWSSSTLPLNDDILGGSSAWVYLADPTSENFSSGQKTDSFHVRAVRGGFGPL